MTCSRLGVYVSFIVILLGNASSRAQAPGEDTPGVEFAAAVNLIRPDTKIEGRLFVPQNVTRIRGVLVVIDYGSMAPELYQDKSLRRVLQNAGCAVVLARISNIQPSKPDPPISAQPIRNAAAGGGDALLLLLQRLGNESGRQEVRSVPMMFWGWSAAASFGTTFGALHPERTIGFIRYHGHRRGLAADMEILKQIPALLIAGGKDETAGVDDAEQLWSAGRVADSPWTFAVEPESPHFLRETHNTTARELTIPWIAAVLRLRLSEGRGLRRVSDDVAWLADSHTSQVASYQRYTGDRRTANWLPDERSAQGWQTVVRSTK